MTPRSQTTSEDSGACSTRSPIASEIAPQQGAPRSTPPELPPTEGQSAMASASTSSASQTKTSSTKQKAANNEHSKHTDHPHRRRWSVPTGSSGTILRFLRRPDGPMGTPRTAVERYRLQDRSAGGRPRSSRDLSQRERPSELCDDVGDRDPAPPRSSASRCPPRCLDDQSSPR